MRPEFVLVVAAVVGALSAGRLTRLFVEDSYPPSVWLRMKWDTITKDGPWSKLAHCPWCAAPYPAAAVILWGYFSNLHISWWLFNGWLALSYVASWIVFHDED